MEQSKEESIKRVETCLFRGQETFVCGWLVVGEERRTFEIARWATFAIASLTMVRVLGSS
jgi:hypothetical protein